MTLYEINEAKENALIKSINEETGEIDFEQYEAELGELQIAKDEKIKNAALLIINLRAEAESYAEQERKFKQKKQRVQNLEKRIFERLQLDLNGESFKCTEVEIKYRKSNRVEIVNDVDFELFAIDHPEYIKPFKIEADKTAIKKAITDGIEIPGCAIIEIQNMQID